MKLFTSLSILLLLIALSPRPVMAAPNTEFSACINPQGQLIADYSNGTHGIVNNTGSYSGSDKVYKLSNGNVMQCFCPPDNQGIQTNWLKNTGFTEAEVAVLKNQGWTSVPDGSVWGLEPVQYLAMNSSYSCAGTSNPTPNNPGSNNPGPSNNSTPSVLGANTTVLTTLANTGDSLLLYSTLSFGLALILVGIFLPGDKKSSQ